MRALHNSITRSGRPPLVALDTVRVVARAGSLTEAATELGLTHGTVSRRLASVESWLGQTLFERHARGVRPTPEGQRFLVRIEIAVEHRIADLERGEADLAIRCGGGRWSNLDARPLMPEKLFPIARPELAQRLGNERDVRGWLDQPLLHDSDLTGWRAWFASIGVALKPRPQDRRFEDYLLVLAAAEAGLGMALARSPMVDQELADSASLVRLSRREVDSPLRHYIVTRAGENRPAVRALIARMLLHSGELEEDSAGT